MEDSEATSTGGDSVSTILVRTWGERSGARGECLNAIASGATVDREVFVVTADSSPGTIVDEWHDRVGRDPGNLGVVAVGASMRSAASPDASGDPAASRNVVRGVADLDAAIDVLSGRTGDGAGPIVFVDSLTTLCDECGRGAVVDLIDDVAAPTSDVGATAYLRADSERCDAETVAVFATVSDAVVDVTGRGRAFADHVDAGGALDSSGEPGRLSGPSQEDVLDLLSDRRRRVAVHLLRRADRSLSIEDLAERVVEFELDHGGDLPESPVERTYVGLAHVHLPPLEAAGVVTFDRDEGTVATHRTGALEPHLSLTAIEDLGG